MLRHIKKWWNPKSEGAEDALHTLMAVSVLLAVHFATTMLPRNWGAWAVAVPPLTIVMITAIARLNDIVDRGWIWFTRRIGMILVASGALALIAAPVLGYTGGFPSWRAVCFYWGFALCWITTPSMPPWWRYISGDKELKKGQNA